MSSSACFHLMPSTPVPLHLQAPGPPKQGQTQSPSECLPGPLTISWVLPVATWP